MRISYRGKIRLPTIAPTPGAATVNSMRLPCGEGPAPSKILAGATALGQLQRSSDRETESSQRLPNRGVVEQGPEPPYGRALQFRLRNDEIVVLVLNWNEPESVLACDAFDRHTPIGSVLRHRDGNGIVRLRL